MTTQNNQQPQNTKKLINRATIVGEVFKIDLKYGEQKKDGAVIGKSIRGTVEVKVAENETHKIAVSANQFNKDGDTNKNFTALETIQREYVTISDLANPENEGKYEEGTQADKVKVNTKVTLNEYYDATGKLQGRLEIGGMFGTYINRFDFTKEEYEPKAEFVIDGIIESVTELYDPKTTLPTGEAKITMMIPDYNTYFNLDFVLPEEYKQYAMQYFSKDLTMNLFGKIVNFSKEELVEIPSSFGPPRTEKKFHFKQELRVVGGDLYDPSNIEKSHSVEEIAKLHADRNISLAQKKEYAEKRAKEKKQGGANTPGQVPGFSGMPKAPGAGGASPNLKGVF